MVAFLFGFLFYLLFFLALLKLERNFTNSVAAKRLTSFVNVNLANSTNLFHHTIQPRFSIPLLSARTVFRKSKLVSS